MSGTFLPLLIVLVLLAAFLRGDFALTLIYLVVGALAAGIWWARRALRQVNASRTFPEHAFLGEKVHVQLRIQNLGWLPVPWLELRETLPVALVGPNSFQSVIHLEPHGQANFEYSVDARKRGYYPIGPLSISTGDILGLSDSLQMQSPPQGLVIYPKIIPLPSTKIPSRSPQGTLRHSLPLFEDPTRMFGKRGYVSGDSLRRIDWKSTASSGRLQVKLFEPSIALETYILLNLNGEDYYYRSRVDSTELAIVIAASIASWIVEKKQRVGMLVNGHDPLTPGQPPQPMPPHKGKRHLMRLLETLARVEMIDSSTFVRLVQQHRYQLAWGTTLLVITGNANNELLHELGEARRAGQNPVLLLAGRDADDETTRRRASVLGIPVSSISTEKDLLAWSQGMRSV